MSWLDSWVSNWAGTALDAVDGMIRGAGGSTAFENAVGKHREALGAEGLEVAHRAYVRFLSDSGDAKISALKAVAFAFEERNKATEPVPPIHGSARWAHMSELLRGNLLGAPEEVGVPGKRILIGLIANVEKNDTELDPARTTVMWDGEAPMLTVAPTRKGKGASQIIPTLLRYPGSVLVMDPKGENYKLTAGMRHLLGSRIIKIDPFNVLDETRAKDDNIDYGDTDAFNPLDQVKTESDARVLAELIYPPVPTGLSPNAEYYSDEAINFLTAVILWVVKFCEDKTLAEVRRLVSLREIELQTEFLEAMAGEPNDETIAIEGMLLLRKKVERRQEVVFSLNTKLSLWREDGIGKATARSDFQFEELKDDVLTVYVIVPFNKMETYSAFLRMIFTTATQAMLKSQRNLPVPVLFLLDEFASMGAQDDLVRSMSYLSGYDVRLWLFVQSLAMLEELYPTKWEQILDNAEIKTFMNVQGRTAELLSRWMGSKTVSYETTSESASSGQSSKMADWEVSSSSGESRTTSTAYAARPLMTPDEVKQWLSYTFEDDAKLSAVTACFVDGQRPFGVQRSYWFCAPVFREMVAEGRAYLKSGPPVHLSQRHPKFTLPLFNE